ncbi:MAG TPA: ATP-binding protein [Jiangellaceae bacterium]|nr:ATP-binding protein [Jiangellaceae bacterium]
MALVELSLPAQAAYVRTARQVAVALARRAELTEDVLEEIRLAVAEACGLALSVLRNSSADEVLAVDFDDGNGFTVEVRAEAQLPHATGAAALEVVAEAASVDVDDAAELPAGAALAVLSALAPVLDAATSTEGMRLKLGWPAAPA